MVKPIPSGFTLHIDRNKISIVLSGIHLKLFSVAHQSKAPHLYWLENQSNDFTQILARRRTYISGGTIHMGTNPL
jgi:hypothetical protein